MPLLSRIDPGQTREYRNVQAKTSTIKCFNPEVKPMIENLPDELYQLENEYAKCGKLMQILYWSLKVKNASKHISMCLKDNIQNPSISELYTDQKKTNYSSNTNDILKSAKNFYEKIYTKRKQSPNRKKISNEQFHLFEAEFP